MTAPNRTLVSDGSDLIESIGEDVGRVVDGLISKMSGKQVFTLAILVAVLYFSSIVARDWIDKTFEEKSREGISRERIAMSDQETKRLGIVTDALQRHPEVNPELRR